MLLHVSVLFMLHRSCETPLLFMLHGSVRHAGDHQLSKDGWPLDAQIKLIYKAAEGTVTPLITIHRVGVETKPHGSPKGKPQRGRIRCTQGPKSHKPERADMQRIQYTISELTSDG